MKTRVVSLKEVRSEQAGKRRYKLHRRIWVHAVDEGFAFEEEQVSAFGMLTMSVHPGDNKFERPVAYKWWALPFGKSRVLGDNGRPRLMTKRDVLVEFRCALQTALKEVEAKLRRKGKPVSRT